MGYFYGILERKAKAASFLYTKSSLPPLNFNGKEPLTATTVIRLQATGEKQADNEIRSLFFAEMWEEGWNHETNTRPLFGMGVFFIFPKEKGV
jgi:hypothetical protein